ncbi:hypothetical protein IAD21_03770 [Abditibacteriota bacterium]|nr:hypothetical protein IAD21_03770 [Abditibacteriota bacterium]
MKVKFPISGYIIIEADDEGVAEKALACWLFGESRKNRGNELQVPDLFGDAKMPDDVIIKIDHNHVTYSDDEDYKRIIKELRLYQEKKLAKFLRKKERDQVLEALKKSDSS